MGKLLRVGAFAALAGVSVRTLHHYDRIGLVRPSGRSESGQRLYSEWDLLHLQRVLALRYLGFPLATIGRMIASPDGDWVASLEQQRAVLQGRAETIIEVLGALDHLLAAQRTAGSWDWTLVADVTAVTARALIEGGTSMERSPEMQKRWDALGRAVGEETRLDIERRWADLMEEVRANLGLDPSDPKARALADRWQALTEETSRHYQDNGAQDLWDQVGERYQAGEFENHPHAPSKELFDFVARVNAAR